MKIYPSYTGAPYKPSYEPMVRSIRSVENIESPKVRTARSVTLYHLYLKSDDWTSGKSKFLA